MASWTCRPAVASPCPDALPSQSQNHHPPLDRCEDCYFQISCYALVKPPTNSFHKRTSGSLTRCWKKVVVVGATLAATLNAGLASALDFTFTFSGQGYPTDPGTVTGIISRLVDNLDNQTTGITATILSATNGPSGGGTWGPFTDANYRGGTGFDVSGGAITGVDILWYKNSSTFPFLLQLGNTNGYPPVLQDEGFLVSFTVDQNSSSQNSLRFALVPGPLPLFGAAAAFGWSRRLRRRCRATA